MLTFIFPGASFQKFVCHFLIFMRSPRFSPPAIFRFFRYAVLRLFVIPSLIILASVFLDFRVISLILLLFLVRNKNKCFILMDKRWLVYRNGRNIVYVNLLHVDSPFPS